jgi:hypothetical protein
MVGPPASGKSTWGKEFAQKVGAKYISTDAIRAEFGKGEGDQSINPFGAAMGRVRNALTQGRHVVIDATNINRSARKTYIDWAKSIGADSVRFAELKIDEDNFVDLGALLNHQYGLNDDPFINGCHKESVIDGMPVNFRQMCGLQTTHRPAPINPKQHAKEVLYYDGKIYAGWQSPMFPLDEQALDEILQGVAEGKISKEEAKRLIH